MRTEVINGIRYYIAHPNNCKLCPFWKNKKAGCVLGMENCYFLAEPIKTEQEKECENCLFTSTHPCVAPCCYKKFFSKSLNRGNPENAGAGND